MDGDIKLAKPSYFKKENGGVKMRKYEQLAKDIIFNVAKAFCSDVEEGNFPNVNESFTLEIGEIEKLENYR